MKKFCIHKFGPIEDVSVDFGDLTILVGPQASGKSIMLETLKLAVDRNNIIDTLDRYNYINGVVSKGIKVSNDGSSVKFFLEQYASLCYHHSKYKAFYEFYTIVKDLI